MGQSSRSRLTAWVIVVSIILGACAAAAPNSGTPTSTSEDAVWELARSARTNTATQAESLSWASKLATIDGQSLNSAVEQQYQRELSKATLNCDGFVEGQVANLVTRGTQVIAEGGGVPTKTLELLESLNDLFEEDGFVGSDCRELLALVITIMLNG